MWKEGVWNLYIFAPIIRESSLSCLTAIRWLSFCRCETWRNDIAPWWSVFIQAWISSVHSQQKSGQIPPFKKQKDFHDFNCTSIGQKGFHTIASSHICNGNDARKVWPLCEHRHAPLLSRTLQVLWDANSGKKRCEWQIPCWQKISKTDLKRQTT